MGNDSSKRSSATNNSNNNNNNGNSNNNVKGDPKMKKRFASMNEDTLRLRGNEYFKQGNYPMALEFYSEIIRKNPSNHIALTNRANTYLRLNRFEESTNDCVSALKLVPDSIKASYYLGESLCQSGNYDTGIMHLENALSIGKRHKKIYETEITEKLKTWQQKRYLENQDKRKIEEIELRCHLTSLILQDKERQVKTIKDKYENKKGENRRKKDKDDNLVLSKNDEESISTIEKFTEKLLRDTRIIFEKAEEENKKREIPDFFCCKITMEMMKEPVTTPDGITYEKSALLEHLRVNGNFDPTTRNYLTAEHLINNYSLREALENWISENEWAFNEE